MDILITGGTGLIGRHLIRKLRALSYRITVFTRNARNATKIFGETVNTVTTLAFKNLNEFDAVINLAGEPIIGHRWTQKQKNKLCQSRWNITNRLSLLIQESDKPPSVFISSSATGYYGNQNNNPVDEYADPMKDFGYLICKKWEELALLADSKKTRVCLSRTGVVLAKDGGLLKNLLPLYKIGLGGKIGSGNQFISWIHIDDVVNALLFMLCNHRLTGPFNVCTPYPEQNKNFSAILAKTLNRPACIRIPAWFVKLLLGEGASIILNGQRAIPKRLIESGFTFCFSKLQEALTKIIFSQ